ncbi:hypothetical protein CI610_00307 [invertebrate metagenome]|uniref:DUF3108 domain-containing protein n=1 Tax=invertebrate metagenome TaxID=1711999 RepID=A0A2H9TBT7_9ZZZZ
MKIIFYPKASYLKYTTVIFYIGLAVSIFLPSVFSSQSFAALSTVMQKNINASEKYHEDSSFLTIKPYQATLKATLDGTPFKGTGTRTLTKNSQGEWEFHMSAKIAFFSIKEDSRFRIENQQVIPLQYCYKRDGIGGKPADTALFDWKNMKVNWQNKKRKWSFPLKKGAMDELSYQLQLQSDLQARKKILVYKLVDDDEIYERRFIIEGEETLKTDMGLIDTVRVKINRDDNERETWIWFAPKWDYFFIRLLQKERGKSYNIELKSAVIDGVTVTGNTKK